MPAPLRLEDKLAVLGKCGFVLAPPFTVDDLLASWARQDLEEPGYDMVLVGLGGTEEREPWRNRCVNLWHFDTECIEDDGDYVAIAKRMAEMTQGGVSLTEIQDHVDVEAREAWLSFVTGGQRIRIDCTVKDDWVDEAVLNRFQSLLTQSAHSKTFVYYDTGGQDCIIGCVTREQLKELQSHGVGFRVLGGT
jgi:hypothetical protein